VLSRSIGLTPLLHGPLPVDRLLPSAFVVPLNSPARLVGRVACFLTFFFRLPDGNHLLALCRSLTDFPQRLLFFPPVISQQEPGSLDDMLF